VYLQLWTIAEKKDIGGNPNVFFLFPISSKCKNILTHVRIDPVDGGLSQTSYCMCEQVRAISVTRLKSQIGTVKSKKILADVRDWITDLIVIE